MSNSLTLREIFQALFWQKRLIVLAFLAIFIPVAVKTMLEPKVYTATAKVLYKRSAPNLTFGSNFVRTSQEEEINSELEIIRSTPVMERVLERLIAWKKARGQIVDRETGKPLPEPGTVAWSKAIVELQKAIKVKPLEGSNVIAISYDCEDPEEAALVVGAAAEEYIRYHVRVHRPRQADAFFAERIQETKARLDSLEEALVAFQKEHGIISYDQQQSMALDRIGTFDQRLSEIKTRIIAQQSRLAQLRSFLKDSTGALPGREVADYPLVMQLRQRLVDLRLRRADLLRRYKPTYSEVKLVEKEIQQTQEELRDQVAELVQLEEGSLRALQAEARALQTTLSYLGAKIKELPDKERVIAGLQLAIDETRRIYSLLMQRYEEARITEASDPRVANVAIVDPARVPAEPSGPRKARNLVLGFLFAFVGSVSLALVAHRMDPTFKTPNETGSLGGGDPISIPDVPRTTR